MSIRPAQNKLVLQVVSNQTLFKIDFKLGVDLPPVLPVSGPFFLAIKITSKLSNFILHQFGGLHKLWDAPF